jgi:hypothetical protein
MTKAKPQKARKTRPSLRVSRRSLPPGDEEEAYRRRSEAETLPPPPKDEPPKHSARVKKGRPTVTVDVVTADMSKDKRRED